MFEGHHDIQRNDTHHNDTQPNNKSATLSMMSLDPAKLSVILSQESFLLSAVMLNVVTPSVMAPFLDVWVSITDCIIHRHLNYRMIHDLFKCKC